MSQPPNTTRPEPRNLGANTRSILRMAVTVLMAFMTLPTLVVIAVFALGPIVKRCLEFPVEKPDLRQTPNGMSVATLRVAVNRRWQDRATNDLYAVRSWGGGYFGINAAGHIVCHPGRDAGRRPGTGGLAGAHRVAAAQGPAQGTRAGAGRGDDPPPVGRDLGPRHPPPAGGRGSKVEPSDAAG